MLKHLSKVRIEFNPRQQCAAALEFLAQCNSQKSRDSNPKCEVVVQRRTDGAIPSITVREQRFIITRISWQSHTYVQVKRPTSNGCYVKNTGSVTYGEGRYNGEDSASNSCSVFVFVCFGVSSEYMRLLQCSAFAKLVTISRKSFSTITITITITMTIRKPRSL